MDRHVAGPGSYVHMFNGYRGDHIASYNAECTISICMQVNITLMVCSFCLSGVFLITW